MFRAGSKGGNEYRLVRVRRALRLVAALIAVLLLLPCILLAVLPMLLMLRPVACVAAPFIISAMLSGSLAAHSELRARNSRQHAPRQVPDARVLAR